MGEDDELDLPPDISLDRWIEVLVIVKDNAELRKVASKHDYAGDDPKIMLKVYDTIHDLPNGIYHGIKGFEFLNRDPKVITELQNPDNLVDYVVATTDSLDDLVKLQETIIKKGEFYPQTYNHNDEFAETKKHLAQSLLKVAFEIADRQKNVGKDEKSIAEFSDPFEHIKHWRIRLDAHIAIVMAYQVTKGISEETLDAIAAYESLSGNYQPYSGNMFSWRVLEAYFKRKHAVDTLNKGEIPEELKAEPRMWRPIYEFGPDQYFRSRYFGEKRIKFGGPKNEGTQGKKDEVDELFEILKDPWAYYKKELELLGLNKDMEFDEAKRKFRRCMMDQRVTFIRMDTETPEYKDATRKTQDFLEAWRKLEPFYRSKLLQQQPSAN